MEKRLTNILFFLNPKNHGKNKIVRNFLKKIKFEFFVEFFTENFFQPLLRGRETTRKKY